MYKHPCATASLLRCKTLFESKGDGEAVDMRKEHTVDRQPFVTYLKRWDQCLGISRDVVTRSARRLNPVELQFQALSEILHHQRMRQNDSAKYNRISPMEAPFVKSLGVELATDIEQLIDRFETNRDKPSSWLDSMTRIFDSTATNGYGISRLERESFQKLSQHWEKQGYLTKEGNTDDLQECSNNDDEMDNTYILSAEPKQTTLWELLGYKQEKQANSICDIRPQRTLSLPTLERINANLEKYGIAVVRNVFEARDVDTIRRMMHLKGSMARDSAYKILETDANVSVVKHTRGRIQCLLRGTSFDAMLRPLQQFWIPIVYYMLGGPFYVSNINLVTTDAMSFVEPWHRNNRSLGITVIVSLDDIDDNSGRMQFLPGTHRKNSEINPFKFGKVGVNLKKGDVLIFDSRLLHRHTINDSNSCRSCLVYSYDYTSTPPPGQGALQFMMDKWRGTIIDAVSR